MPPIRCANCAAALVGHDSLVVGFAAEDRRALCTHCFNVEVAGQCARDDVKDIEFAPVVLADRAGAEHVFAFRLRLLGYAVSLEAVERRDGSPDGYVFGVVADATQDLPALMAQLIAKMRRALAIRHLAEDEHGLHVVERTVRGRIDWDDAAPGRMPLMIVDGEAVSWKAFGALLMGFEGWQFRLELVDPADEA